MQGHDPVAIEAAIANIRTFHAAQAQPVVRVETQPGVVCELRTQPISRVGLYVPGGSAPLPSTVMMLAIPASLAGCREVVLCTPSPASDEILFAARACGVEKVFAIGGAQAIAAMAYGTESIPKVDKIFGPGNGFDLNQSQFLDVEAFSQEVRLASPEDGRAFNWMVGGYLIDTTRFISTGNMIDTGNGVFPVFRTPSTNPLNPQFSFLSDGQDNFAWALFANAGYELSPEFRVDASLRYDRDKRRQTTLTPQAFLPVVPGVPQAQSGEVRTAKFDDWQPKLTLTYEPTPDLTIYGGYSRGFRSGGFNQTGVGAEATANAIVGVGDIFRAETADTFEVGAKAQIGPVRLAGAAYTTLSKNSYFFVFLAQSSTQNLGNIPETRLTGFELEATAEILPDFDINAAIGITDSEIKEFPDASVIGNKAPQISNYTLNLGAQYAGALSDSVDGLVRIDYRRTGKTWWEPFNTTVRQPVDIVDARAGVTLANGVSITAFAQNLFDETYNAEFSPGGFVFRARPARYGFEVGYKF